MSLVSHENADYQALIDELDVWQGLFEIALDEAARYLDQEQFPSRELQASLVDMCDLLRDVLLNSRPRYVEK
jgi:hypothetical protein